MLNFALLGPLLVTVDERTIDISAAKQRMVMGTLIVHANHVVGFDELIDALWDGNPPNTAAATLRTNVARLRRGLGPIAGARIETCPPGYRLRAADDELDLRRFATLSQRAFNHGQTGSWQASYEAASEALALWRGAALSDIPSLPLQRDEVPLLAEQRLQALEIRLTAELHLGRHQQAAGELARLVSAHPMREHLVELLMLALYRSGRQAEALDAYQSSRTRLVEELGVDPGRGLSDLYRRILAADATLAAPVVDVHRDGITESAPITVVPRQLPSAIGHFTGREVELKKLTTLMEQTPTGGNTIAISAIGGMGGIGKTALAVHWGRQNIDAFPDGQLYVNLRGFDQRGRPTPPSEAVRGFLDALQVPSARIPTDVDAQIGLYRSLLAGKRMLIILDNAYDADQARPLLPGESACVALVTSRRDLSGLVAIDGATPLTLDLISADEAYDLLRRRLGADRVDAEADAVAIIVRLCGLLPLALNIAAARAARRPDVPLATLAAELSDADVRLAGPDPADQASTVRAVFWWSYRMLDTATARMFRLLGTHPGPDITVAAAASLAATSRDQARGALNDLTHAHLLTEHVPGRYTLHDLLRDYAVERAARDDTSTERRVALHRALDHYLHTAAAADRHIIPHRTQITLLQALPGVRAEDLADDRAATAWFDAERSVLVGAVTHAAQLGFDAHAAQLAWTLATDLDRSGHWPMYITCQQVALLAAERGGDLGEQALAHRGLGRAYVSSGADADALLHLGHALDLYERMPDLINKGRIHLMIASVLERQKRYREALEHAQLALSLLTDSDHRVGEAAALNSIGWYHILLHDYQQALASCRRALDIQSELGNIDGQAATWDSLGYAHHHLGAYAQALTCYDNALALQNEIGDRYRRAVILDHIGDTRCAVDKHDAARDAYRLAVEILDSLTHPDADAVRAKLAALPPR